MDVIETDLTVNNKSVGKRRVMLADNNKAILSEILESMKALTDSSPQHIHTAAGMIYTKTDIGSRAFAFEKLVFEKKSDQTTVKFVGPGTEAQAFVLNMAVDQSVAGAILAI